MRTFFRVPLAIVCFAAVAASAQEPARPDPELDRVSRELQETRAELKESRRQIEELRQGLEALRSQVQAKSAAEAPAPNAAAAAPTPVEPSSSSADQDPGFLAAKVAELHQDKVESTSKYPVRISGLILFNSYRNNGQLDAEDLPSLAFPRTPGESSTGVGSTLGQTLLGVEVTGPRIFGARTSADVEVDFAGGSPPIEYGAATGLIRLRTANLHLDWEKTSLHIGQDVPFFSPLSPTSYATVFEPAMSWSGNLWVWTPQVEVEHRLHLSDGSALVLQGGLLDPFTEEVPQFQGRAASPGEETGMPAFAGRIAWDRSRAERFPFTLGFAGYRAKQRYEPFKDVDSWTLNTDLKMQLGNHVAISGEFYRGVATGGLGGGIWTSVTYPENTSPHTAVHALRSVGGWAQLKVSPTERFEINGAFGQDENFARDLHLFPYSAEGFGSLKKNRTEFVNFIYKPNSILLFALEYRHIYTAQGSGVAASGQQINAAAGVRF